MSKKIKQINNKIELNKAQYDLNRQTANISALSSGDISKYELLTGKDVYQKNLLHWKIFNIHHQVKNKLVRHKLVLQNNKIKKNRKFFESNKKEEKITNIRAKSNTVYSKGFTFYKYHNINELNLLNVCIQKNNNSNNKTTTTITEFKDALETLYYYIK